MPSVAIFELSDSILHPHINPQALVLSDDMLDQTMLEINEAAEKRMAELVSGMQKSEGVTETLKAQNRNEWILRRNNIRARAADIVKTELFFK